MGGESKVQHSQEYGQSQQKGPTTLLIKDVAVTGRSICLQVDKPLSVNVLQEAALQQLGLPK